MQTLPCSANAAVAPPGFPFSTEDNPPLTASTFFVASPTTDPADHSVTVIDGKNANWTPDLSATYYRIDKWGPPYFNVNASGDISVHPYGSSTLSEQEIDLMKIVKKVSDPESAGGLGLRLPLIIQFPEILKNRLDSLNAAFNDAIQTLGYQNRYQGVYPVKCNQHRFIVEDVVKFGYSYQFGLEAGSKPELLLAMSCLSKGHPDAFLVCNGYKDVEFIYLALFARKLGFNTFIVLEQEEEIDIVIDLSKKLNMDPVIGIRAKLRAQHGGHYGSTSGEKGKFGLNTTEIMQVVTKLKNEGMLACLQLLHFHVGSQIPSTDDIAAAVKEASQIYCKLATNGAPMQILDVGGGLGIDYDGSMCSQSNDSVGYTMKEYAETVVLTIQDVCDSNNIDHPVICSESGRAVVSHQSILVFNIISSREYDVPELSAAGLKYLVEGFSEDVRAHYKNLHAAAVRGDRDICLHHTKQLKQRCLEQFKQGSLGIEQLAAVDGLCKLVAKVTEDEDPERYYQMNLSMFTSIVDFLLVDQLFPIVPIHRLAERPTITGVLSDLTCDSDGKITRFIGGKSSLLLHELEGDEGEYYLGMFLGGAYEEAIGGVHNLLGFTTIVQVEPSSDVDDGFEVKRVKLGMSISDVLQRMSYDPNSVLETIKQLATAAGQPTDGLDCFFSNVPYLVSSSPCVDSALNNN